MNPNKTFRSTNILKHAQSLLHKLGCLSVVTLFATTAYANNCPNLNSILNGYVKDNTLVEDYQLGRIGMYVTTDKFKTDPREETWWKLSSNSAQPYITFRNADLKLVSIKLKTLATGNDSHPKVDPKYTTIDTVICEYKDKANLARPDSLFLTGQSVGMLTTTGYVSIGGKIDRWDKWDYDEFAPVINNYSCTGTKLDTGVCGKFTFETKEDTNGFWNDAWGWCYYSKSGCKGDDGWIAKIEKLDNTAATYSVCYRYWYGEPYFCNIKLKNKPKCDDLLCTNEINEMNKIVGGYGSNGGMAHNLNMCWSSLKWQNKAWDEKYKKTTGGCTGTGYDPVGTWPDYSHFGIGSQ